MVFGTLSCFGKCPTHRNTHPCQPLYLHNMTILQRGHWVSLSEVEVQLVVLFHRELEMFFVCNVKTILAMTRQQSF